MLWDSTDSRTRLGRTLTAHGNLLTPELTRAELEPPPCANWEKVPLLLAVRIPWIYVATFKVSLCKRARQTGGVCRFPKIIGAHMIEDRRIANAFWVFQRQCERIGIERRIDIGHPSVFIPAMLQLPHLQLEPLLRNIPDLLNGQS